MMQGISDRRELWRAAQLLDALSCSEHLVPRYRQFRGEASPHLVFWPEDLGEAASWPVRQAAELPLFLKCIGAAQYASAWRSSMDGKRLRGLATVLSEALLDAALALDPLSLPSDNPEIAEDDDLQAVGQRLLLAALPSAPARNDALEPAQVRMAIEAGSTLFGQARTSDA